MLRAAVSPRPDTCIFEYVVRAAVFYIPSRFFSVFRQPSTSSSQHSTQAAAKNCLYCYHTLNSRNCEPPICFASLRNRTARTKFSRAAFCTPRDKYFPPLLYNPLSDKGDTADHDSYHYTDGGENRLVTAESRRYGAAQQRPEYPRQILKCSDPTEERAPRLRRRMLRQSRCDNRFDGAVDKIIHRIAHGEKDQRYVRYQQQRYRKSQHRIKQDETDLIVSVCQPH